MYVVNQTNNSIEPLGKKTFSESGFSERAHLQEWIVSHPEVFGEKLLIIQKEFSGFLIPMKDSIYWLWIKMVTWL